MKLQSLIAAIMHGGLSAARGLLISLCLVSAGCMSLIAGKHTYSASSSAVRVNGADIRMQVKPEGTAGGSYALSAMVVGAAVATFDGPFRWRLEATGEAGRHESLVVHRIHTRTGKTKRDEWYPREHLGYRHDFKTVKNQAGTARAVYPIPGLLVVKPLEDGNLEVTVDLTVTADGSSERKLVLFRMDPAEKRQDEFIFLPAEIVQNIGKSAEEWDDQGWD
ncbi:MAG: hypothetical protein EHM17_03465 [Verrucomicrobiaceae bacterium]|nr:MAG: hypothetical protein EHM17_03465 [Verrucomicrobiaceae bacterium]